MIRYLLPTFRIVTVTSSAMLAVFNSANQALADDSAIANEYRETIRPILTTYCYDCHSGKAQEGGMQLDIAEKDAAVLKDQKLWWAVLKNVRSGLMPPVGNDRPTDQQRDVIENWIETKVFGVVPNNPDPGRVTVHRLNRTEYRNTIRDLTGIDFDAEVVFPPDDTGFGFDNVSDALTLSPLMLEKYMQSAKTIVEQAVPTVTWVVPTIRWSGRDFTTEDGSINGARILHHQASTLKKSVKLEHAGKYKVSVRERQHGSFDFHPGRYQITFSIDGQERYKAEYKWEENKQVVHEFNETWEAGEHEIAFVLTPIEVEDPKGNEPSKDNANVRYELNSVVIEGPSDETKWNHPDNYKRFFSRDLIPVADQDRRAYAKEVLQKFATRAFRRPSSDTAVERLTDIAEFNYKQAGKSFESGVAQAMVAVLASPRFLFRIEDAAPNSGNGEFPFIDEYSLASRMSYFFWSTMPDEELFELARSGQLRDKLSAQTKRMLMDKRSEALVKNFVGQWLRARDVEHTPVDPIAALGLQKELEQLRARFPRQFGRRGGRGVQAPTNPEDEKARNRLMELTTTLPEKFNPELRAAMRKETEMSFEYLVRNDRSLLELLDSNYTFVNEKLAEHYGMEGVKGPEMRRVELPEASPRGGVLTQATMLLVTSNPTRTSPVKRGLFILDNILGTPAPPAPPNVPELEAAQDRFGDREPTLRELLAVHREAALCASCHSRMDPLGLALENFNALGMWRESDKEQPIDAAGELITGEKFQNVHELKKILTTTRREDFYRCVTQKLLTYALGRGLEYYDEYTVDRIVDELEKNQGRFSILLNGVLDSAPFQKQRRPLERLALTQGQP